MRVERIVRGVRVQTNAAFAELFMEEDQRLYQSLPWTGEAMHPFDRIEGCWAILFDNIPVMQYISEDYLEVAFQ
jgi:hypothetical protein